MSVNASRRISRLLSALLGLLVCQGAQAMDLLDLYERAREFDPVFQAARYERAVADQVLRESQAGVRPEFSADLEGRKTYQDIRESENFLFQVGRTDYLSDRFALSLVQPVYRSDAFRRIPQARAEVRQAESSFDAAEQDLMFRLAQAHFNYLAALDNLEFATAERRAIRQQLEESEERLGLGLTTLTDVHDARAKSALAEADEIEALDILEDNRRAIAEITGMIPTDLSVLGETFPIVEPDPPNVEFWVEAALFQNPAVKALEEAAEIAQREINVQRGAHLPRVDLVASFDNSDTGGTVFGGGNHIVSTELALRVGIPIYNGGRTSALTERAALTHQIALQELEREKRRIERETRTSFQQVVSGVTRVRALEKSVFSHEAALAAKDEGLRSGLNTGRDVLDARRDLFLVKRDLTQARYLYILNRLRLKQVTGILHVDDLKQVNAYLQ